MRSLPSSLKQAADPTGGSPSRIRSQRFLRQLPRRRDAHRRARQNEFRKLDSRAFSGARRRARRPRRRGPPQCHRVDDLGQEVVLPDMQPVLGLARLLADSGAHHLAEAVDVDGLDAARSSTARRICRSRARRRRSRSPAGCPSGLCPACPSRRGCQEVRRGHHDDPGLEVDDQLDLALGHAAADRHHRAARAAPLRSGRRAHR